MRGRDGRERESGLGRRDAGWEKNRRVERKRAKKIGGRGDEGKVKRKRAREDGRKERGIEC